MRYRILSPSGDYTFGASQKNIYRDVPEAVGQAVQTRLLLFLGEWFLNLDEGTPYFLGILGKFSKEIADATIQDRITTTEGVVNIEQYTSEIEPTERRLFVQATINTIYGPTTVQIENYRNY